MSLIYLGKQRKKEEILECFYFTGYGSVKVGSSYSERSKSYFNDSGYIFDEMNFLSIEAFQFWKENALRIKKISKLNAINKK